MRWRMLRWVAGAAVLCCIAYAGGLFPLARFAAERVSIVAHPAHIEVNGAYLFENVHRFPIRQLLMYPVARERGLSAPEGMVVREAGSGAKPSEGEGPRVAAGGALGMHWFVVRLGPRERAWYVVEYTQRAPAGQGAYVVTTTQRWGRPLEHAVFRLREEGVEVVESNYRLAEVGSGDMWGFEQRNFMPSEDWRFAWEAL